jgi:hypothetical protein
VGKYLVEDGCNKVSEEDCTMYYKVDTGGNKKECKYDENDSKCEGGVVYTGGVVLTLTS